MKLICPTDYSETANNAFRFAVALARQLNSEIDLLHVFQESADEAVAKEQVLHVVHSDLDSIKKAKLDAYLQHLLEPLKSGTKEIAVNAVVQEGDPIEQIAEYSKSMPFHLLVMGTKGESDDADKAIGSITSEVIRNVYSPVLAVPSKATYKGIRKIVYAIDYDAYDKFTINSLASFAGKFDAELIILHVNPVQHYFDSERWANFKRTMNSSYDYENLKFEFLQNENITQAIDQYVRQNDIDILAMLTRSYHLIDRAFARSLTREMALHSNVPLLAFHD